MTNADATDAVLIAILRRIALLWIDAARLTWRGMGAWWSVMCGVSKREQTEALGDVLEWIERAGHAAEMRDVEVCETVKVLASKLNQQEN